MEKKKGLFSKRNVHVLSESDQNMNGLSVEMHIIINVYFITLFPYFLGILS